MDQETKQEFQKIDREFQKMNHEFEELTQIIGESFVKLEEKMATKDDLKNFATKEDLLKVETRLEQKIDDLRVEIRSLREEIGEVKNQLERLEKMTKEDNDAFAGDILYLRGKVKELEQRVARVETARADV